MSRTLILAVLCLIFGAVLGSSVSNYLAQRHQHTRAVMWLSQYHLDRAVAAARAHQCERLSEERMSLVQVYQELRQAFPVAYAQDAQFRARADALKDAAQPSGTPAIDCADAGAAIKRIRDACDACHRQYRD